MEKRGGGWRSGVLIYDEIWELVSLGSCDSRNYRRIGIKMKKKIVDTPSLPKSDC